MIAFLKDRHVALCTSPWLSIAKVVVIIWLTVTAFLYCVLSSDGSEFSLVPLLVGNATSSTQQERSYNLRPATSQGRRKTAHEKFVAWATAHQPQWTTHNVGRQPQSINSSERKDSTTPMLEVVHNKFSFRHNPTGVYAEETLQRLLDDEIIRKGGKKLTAHEKLEAYAGKSLPNLVNGFVEPTSTKGAKKEIMMSSADHQSRTHTQREVFEIQYPPGDMERIHSFVDSQRDPSLEDSLRQSISSSNITFDPFDCPDTPPPGYPLHYPLVDMLKEWPVDELKWPTPGYQSDNGNHPYLYQSLCIFDWNRPGHQKRIRHYQVDYDVPIVIRNHPEFLKASERWLRPLSDGTDYLQALIGDAPQRTEHSFHSNHLPFWRKSFHQASPPGWVEPTENLMMPYAEWSQRSDAMDAAIDDGQDHTNLDHYYFRLNGLRVDEIGTEKNAFLYDEFPIFDPALHKEGENLFMLHPNQARGINCRLGMAGNIAESHFDYGANYIALLSGQRRYILSHPRECGKLALWPAGHPSSRHSSVNWSSVGSDDRASSKVEESLSLAMANQVVLQASDALYLPTNWMHFIVNLSRNYQCNARSGHRTHYNSYMAECGFQL